MNEGSPARKAMAFYFMHDKSMSGRGGNRVTLPTALSNDYYSMFGKYVKTSAEYNNLVRVAQNRDAWKGVVQLVVAKYKSNQEAKVLLKTELRHAAKNRSAEDIST